MKKRHVLGAGLFGIGAWFVYQLRGLAAPFVALSGTASKLSNGLLRTAKKHPVLFTLGMTFTGLLAYHTCRHPGEIQASAKKVVYQTRSFVQDYRVDILTQRIDDIATENNELLSQTERQHEHIGELEHIIDDYETDVRHYQEHNRKLALLLQKEKSRKEQVKPREAQKEIISQRSQEFVQYEGFNIYYTKTDDTLAAIAEKVSGNSANYVTIQRDNRIQRPEELLAGQLLFLRREFCTRYNPDVYTRVPKLKAVRIPGNVLVSDVFPETWRQVLELNGQLGLRYGNTFPYKHGERIVYHK